MYFWVYDTSIMILALPCKMIASEPGVPYGKLFHKKLEIAKKKMPP